MKLCKDCRHILLPYYETTLAKKLEAARCGNPLYREEAVVDPVELVVAEMVNQLVILMEMLQQLTLAAVEEVVD